MKKNVEIQILRGVAILLTMAEHTSILHRPILENVRPYLAFWIGVDIFFVISGYMITCSAYPLLNALRERKNWATPLKVFWCKRIFRILPPAWLWIVLTLAMSPMLNQSFELTTFLTILRDAAAAGLHYANFHWADCWVNNGFSKFCSGPAILAYFWSLSLEEQFYLLFPLALIAVNWRWRIPALIMLLLYVGTMPRYPLGYGWHMRIDALILGVLFGLFLQGKTLPTFTWSGAKFLLRCAAPILLLGMMWWGAGGFEWCFSRGGFFMRIWLGAVALLAALLVLLAIFQQRLIWLPRRVGDFLAAIGERSYSLYLAHCPLYGLIKALQLQLVLAESVAVLTCVVALGVIVSFLCAELTYRYVEMPMKSYGVRLASHIGDRSQGLKVQPLARQ